MRLVPSYRLRVSRTCRLTLVRSYSQSMLRCAQNAPQGSRAQDCGVRARVRAPSPAPQGSHLLRTSESFSSLSRFKNSGAVSVSIRGVLLNLSPGIRVFPLGFHLDFSTGIGQKLPIIFVSFFKKRFIAIF